MSAETRVGPASTKTRRMPQVGEPGEHRLEVTASGLDQARGMPAQRRIRRDRALAHDDGDRLVRHQLAGVAARGQAGVVGEHGSGSRQDRVVRGALLVHALAGRGAGDPSAGAVGGGGAAVEGGSPLHRDPRASAADGGQPLVLEHLRLVGQHAAVDDHASGAQALGPASRPVTGVGDRVDDAGDAGREQCLAARTGATGVVAGLERDDRGETGCVGASVVMGAAQRGQLAHRVALGVRSPRAAVPALGDGHAVGVEEDAADLRVATGDRTLLGELERATHRGVVDAASIAAAVSILVWLIRSSVGDRCSGDARSRRSALYALSTHAAAACILPSGL